MTRNQRNLSIFLFAIFMMFKPTYDFAMTIFLTTTWFWLMINVVEALSNRIDQ